MGLITIDGFIGKNFALQYTVFSGKRFVPGNAALGPSGEE